MTPCLWTCHLEGKKGVYHCVCGLAGIQEKLDHFQYLNVKSVWIGPVYSSPMRDFGYDVEDFRAIHPLFGTMDDFEELLADMHDKGGAGNVMVDYHMVAGGGRATIMECFKLMLISPCFHQV